MTIYRSTSIPKGQEPQAYLFYITSNGFRASLGIIVMAFSLYEPNTSRLWRKRFQKDAVYRLYVHAYPKQYATSTRIWLFLKTYIFSSVLGSRPHIAGFFAHQILTFLKTLS